MPDLCVRPIFRLIGEGWEAGVQCGQPLEPPACGGEYKARAKLILVLRVLNADGGECSFGASYKYDSRPSFQMHLSCHRFGEPRLFHLMGLLGQREKHRHILPTGVARMCHHCPSKGKSVCVRLPSILDSLMAESVRNKASVGNTLASPQSSLEWGRSNDQC
jgi:hypothetical protein